MTKDGTQIYYKDRGTGQPVVFSHGCPLSTDSREVQMMFLAPDGYLPGTAGLISLEGEIAGAAA